MARTGRTDVPLQRAEVPPPQPHGCGPDQGVWPTPVVSRRHRETTRRTCPACKLSQSRKHFRHEDYKIVKAGAAALEYDDGNAPTVQILLMRHSLVDSDHDVIAHLLGSCEQ
jgi:hypothetical protein